MGGYIQIDKQVETKERRGREKRRGKKENVHENKRSSHGLWGQ